MTLHSLEKVGAAPQNGDTTEIARRVATHQDSLDPFLPRWARRSNPIVRRQLGMHWRVFLPQLGPIARAVAIQTAMIALSYWVDGLFALAILLVLSAGLIMPMAFYVYALALRDIMQDSVGAITDEFSHGTLPLLRVTPYSLLEIVLSKIAASVWRRMEALDTVLSIALYFSLPFITLFQVVQWPPGEYNGTLQVMIFGIFIASLVRLPLEMFMVACIGIALGTAVRWRGIATTAALPAVAFYFLLINLPRLLDLSVGMVLLVQVVLPLLLPVVISLLCLVATYAMLNREEDN